MHFAASLRLVMHIYYINIVHLLACYKSKTLICAYSRTYIKMTLFHVPYIDL